MSPGREMTPSAFQHSTVPSAPLKINKDSHAIKKPLSSSSWSSISSNSSSGNTIVSKQQRQRQRQEQEHHPIIIYTHPPKTIRTQPKDFKALVQKLTGLSTSAPSNDRKDDRNKSLEDDGYEDRDITRSRIGWGGGRRCDQGNEASFVGNADEKCSSISLRDIGTPSIFDLSNSFRENIPLFVSNPTDLLCRGDSIYDYMDACFPYN